MKNKMILVEFNELTPKLMHEFIADGQLPNFKKFNSSSQVYTTDANAEGEVVSIGGWRSKHTSSTKEAAWFSAQLTPTSTTWAFELYMQELRLVIPLTTLFVSKFIAGHAILTSISYRKCFS